MLTVLGAVLHSDANRPATLTDDGLEAAGGGGGGGGGRVVVGDVNCSPATLHGRL